MKIRKWFSKHAIDLLIALFFLLGIYFITTTSTQHEIGIGIFTLKTKDPNIFKGTICFIIAILLMILKKKKEI